MSETKATDSVEAIEGLFRRWEPVWNEGRLKLVEYCVAPAYIRHDEHGDRVVTPAAFSLEIAATRDRIADLRFTTQARTVAPPLVWERWTMTGTRDGQRVTVAGLGLFRVEDGKLAEVWSASRRDNSRWPDSPE
jgi:hypothetical protein